MPVEAEFWLDWIQASIRLATPLVLMAMGAVFAERSGVFNIGMEGMMLTGAFCRRHAATTPATSCSLPCGDDCRRVLSLVHAYVSITRGADQIISGAAINLLALGLTNFLYRALLGGRGGSGWPDFPQWKIPGLGDIPGLGPLLFDQCGRICGVRAPRSPPGCSSARPGD